LANHEVTKLGNHARLFPCFIECQIEVLRKYLVEVDRCVREVHLSDQNAITAVFIRQILVPRLFTVIAVRKGSIQHALELHRARTRDDTTAAAHHLVQHINRVQDDISTQCEIEARTLEKQGATNRLIPRAPRPPSEVGGRGNSFSTVRMLVSPPALPLYFPVELEAKTHLVLNQACHKFRDRSRLPECCREIVSKMTPVFEEAIRNSQVKGNVVLSDSGMGGILHSVLVYNDDGSKGGFSSLSDGAYRLAQEVRQSIEWLELARIAATTTPGNRRVEADVETRSTADRLFTHSSDYREVSIGGRSFSLTARQAHLVQLLHEAHTAGTPSVSIAQILEGLGTSGSRWQDTFKTDRKAKSALISTGKRKGTLRLKI
jgi:hypothetical protein